MIHIAILLYTFTMAIRPTASFRKKMGVPIFSWMVYEWKIMEDISIYKWVIGGYPG